MIELPRRKFLTGLTALIAAPAIVRAASIMPVRAFVEDYAFEFSGFGSLVPIGQLPDFGTFYAGMRMMTG